MCVCAGRSTELGSSVSDVPKTRVEGSISHSGKKGANSDKVGLAGTDRDMCVHVKYGMSDFRGSGKWTEGGVLLMEVIYRVDGRKASFTREGKERYGKNEEWKYNSRA